MALVYILGVLDDGTKLAPWVPENPRMALQVTQEVSTVVHMEVVNRAGVPMPTTEGATYTLTMKKRPQDIPALITVTGTPKGPNIVEFAFAPSTARNLEWGRYCYDIRMAQGGEANLLIPTSPFLLQPAVSAAS
jgi:hypothetical protein